MKKITQEIQNKMLNDEQQTAVKSAIVKSMRDAYTAGGAIPDSGFENAAANIAEKVVKNVQMSLMESNVFKKIVHLTKPLKTNKKKNVRK